MDNFTEIDLIRRNIKNKINSISNSERKTEDEIINYFLIMAFFMCIDEKTAKPSYLEKNLSYVIAESDKLKESLLKMKNKYDSMYEYYDLISYANNISKLLYTEIQIPSPLLNILKIDLIYEIHDFLSGLKLKFGYEGTIKLYDIIFKIKVKNNSIISYLATRLSANKRYQEMPLIDADPAIINKTKLVLLENEKLDFYLAMRLYINNIYVTYSTNVEFYSIRNGKFKLSNDIYYYHQSALDQTIELHERYNFISIISANSNLGKNRIDRLVNSGRLVAVVEQPNSKEKNKNIYIISSFQYKTKDSVLFIKTKNIYKILKNDNELISELITSIIDKNNNINLVNNLKLKEETNQIIFRFFSEGYKNIPGLCQEVNTKELISKNSLLVDNFIEQVSNELLFSPLDYSLIYKNIIDNDNIIGNYIIGDNGVGKSLLLYNLADRLSNKDNYRVLLVSFGLTDRFYQLKNDNCIYLGDKQRGKSISMKKRNENFTQRIFKIFKNTNRREIFEEVINEIGFSSEIFCMPFNYSFENKHLSMDNDIFKITEVTEPNNYKDYTIAIKRENSDQYVVFENMSSGEQNLLLMFAKIISEVQINDILIIDEPEISMHVSWQQLLPYIFEIISKKINIKIVVATHSPILINSVNLNDNICFNAARGNITQLESKSIRNIEATILDSFGLPTENNRSIYEHCAKIVSNFMSFANNENDRIKIDEHRNIAILEIKNLLSTISKKQNLDLSHEKKMLNQAISIIKDVQPILHNDD